MKKTTLLGIVFGVLVLGYLVFSSMQRHPYRCTLCMVYRGQRNCATTSAKSKDEALRNALMTACGPISGGVIDANQCESTTPQSIEWK